jgi:hypothetical protein
MMMKKMKITTRIKVINVKAKTTMISKMMMMMKIIKIKRTKKRKENEKFCFE